MIGYQGAEAKMLVINGVEKEDYVGMCQSSFEEFSASSLVFFSFFPLTVMLARIQGRTCQIHDSEFGVTS